MQERLRLDPECEVLVWRQWLGEHDSSALLETLTRELSWEQRSVFLFGRWVPQPRLIAWAGTVPYHYSGLELGVRPFHPLVADLCERVNAVTGVRFNHVLLNRYRDGNDSMGWHSDGERELGAQPPVASVSLGNARDFLIRAKNPKGQNRRNSQNDRELVHTIRLGSGDLLLMAGRVQERFVHALPKRATTAGERVSLTFRRVLSAPSD